MFWLILGVRNWIAGSKYGPIIKVVNGLHGLIVY